MNSVHIDIRLLYADGYREPSEPRPCRNQTNPPSIPISQLYADNSFPTGLAMPYTVSDGCCLDTCMWLYDHSYHPQNDQVATQRFTSEEKRALERIQEDMYSDFRRAAEAHRYRALHTYLSLSNGRD